jgi:hypothetical protein
MDSAMKMESPAFSSRGGFGSRSYSLYFPEDPGDDVAKWKRWGAWYLLKDEQINVRLYADWQTAPNGYTMTTVGIDNHHAVDLQSLKDHGDAVVVMLPEDQDHPLLRSLLNRLLYASVAKQSGHVQIPYYEHQGRPDIQQRLDKGTLWFFQDVEGNLIQGATVEVYLYKHKGPRIKLGTYKTDGSIARYAMMGNISDTEFIVSHPDYGRARAQVYRDYDKLYLCLPLVAKDSQAALRAVWGYIIDPDNEPVANVEVYCEHVRTLGEGLINADYDFCRARVLTDENGFFRYYMPPMKKHSPSKFGSLIPPKSQYSLRVEVPFDPLLFSFNGQIPNGEESTIMLQRKAITDLYEDVELVQEGNFHTFSFYNQNGKIEKQEELECVFVEIHRPDAPKIKLNMSHFKAGLKVPNGTYKATSWLRHAGENVHFDPLEVTDESPEELVFAMPMLTYTGRVSHAFTNEPMAGVFVIAMNSSSKGNLSMITDQEWEALHALDSNPSIHDPALKPVDKIYGFENIVRTGEDGRFEMLCPKGDTPYGFVFFEQNYIGLKHRRHELKPNEDGEMEIPAKTMYPAAKVFFQANTDDKRVSICPKWRINKNENPGWVAEFLKNDDRREKLFTYDKWIRRNEVQSVYVPASVKLKLQLRTPYGDDLDDYTYPQTIFLSQGQTMDLGECSFVNNIRLYVKVVDVQGNPVEGVPVRKKIGRSYDIPSMSDAEGISEFMVPPGSGGEFAVTYWGAEDKSHKHLVESIPFQTIDRADEGTTYSFEISNEMVELLFGD